MPQFEREREVGDWLLERGFKVEWIGAAWNQHRKPFRGLADRARSTRGEGVSLTVSTRRVIWMCVRTREEEG